MTAQNMSGLFERAKTFVVFEDVPLLHQIVGALGLAVIGGLIAQACSLLVYSFWADQIPWWGLAIFAMPHLLKGVANLSWSLGLFWLWMENQVCTAMWELGKFAGFALLVLGLSATAAQAAHVATVFSLPIPTASVAAEWLTAYWQHPVFLTLLGLSFVLYIGVRFLWRHRPIVSEGVKSM